LAPATDARAWLDLLFEAVFALPIRLLTFSVTASWFFAGLGGASFFFWGRFLPEGGGDTVDWVVAWVTNSPVTDLGFTTEATFQFIVGIILLLTFPFVLHAMALLEIVAIRAALSHDVEGSGAAQNPGGPRTTAVAASPAAGSQAAPEASPKPSRFQMITGGEGWFWLISVFVG